MTTRHDTVSTGAFLLSIDTELAWGGVHNGSYASRLHLYEGTRAVIARLLDLLERYEIKATWAVVGHLFLESCGENGGSKHPQAVRPSYSWFSGDWFKEDPCTDAAHDPYWYGPDIVEDIMKCRIPQEVGCHGFSHMIIGDPGCSRECFDSELKASQEVAKSWGVELKSFVFPRNSIGHLDVLATNGFTSFRGKLQAWHQGLPGPLKRLGSGMENALPIPPLTTRPVQDESELWDLPATCFYLHRDGWANKLPISMRVLRATKGLRRAARDKSLFHLWFHPFNLASDPEGLLGGLESIFQEVARLRERGMLTSLTMNDMTEQLNAAVVPIKVGMGVHQNK